jgi:hypothetical protein
VDIINNSSSGDVAGSKREAAPLSVDIATSFNAPTYKAVAGHLTWLE